MAGLFLCRKIPAFVPEFPVLAGSVEKMLYSVRVFSNFYICGCAMMLSGIRVRRWPFVGRDRRRPKSDLINDLKGAIKT